MFKNYFTNFFYEERFRISILKYIQNDKWYGNDLKLNKYDIKTGILQFLFAIVIDYIMNHSEKKFGFEYAPRQSSRYPRYSSTRRYREYRKIKIRQRRNRDQERGKFTLGQTSKIASLDCFQ